MGLQRVRHDWATELNWTECDFSGIRPESLFLFLSLALVLSPYNHTLKEYQDAPSIMFIYPFCLNLFSDCTMSRKWISNSLTFCGLSPYALTLPHIFCSACFSPGLILSSLFTMLIPILHLVSTWFGLVTQSCPTLVTPMDYSSPCSPVHRIPQARILEWAAISFPRESSRPRNQPGFLALQADCLPTDCLFILKASASASLF